MNFISTFDELNKLYEETTVKETFNVKNSDGHFSIVQFAKNIHDNLIKNGVDCTVSLDGGYKVKVECPEFEGKAKVEMDKIDDLVKNTKELVINDLEPEIEDHGNFRYYMLSKKDAAVQEDLTEAAEEEIEIVEDEIEVAADDTVAEEPVVEAEPKQVIIECAKCGALVIVDDVTVDEESDLVNVEDECKFCEEKEGYKIVGSVIPYDEATEAALDEVADNAEEAVTEEPAIEEIGE